MNKKRSFVIIAYFFCVYWIGVEYSKDDLNYIDQRIKQFLIYQDKVMSFFGLDKLDQKVYITIWNGIEKYEKHIKGEINRIFGAETEVRVCKTGRAIITKNERQIHILSYKERIKIKGYSKDSIESVIKVSIHELVHKGLSFS